MKIYKIIPVFLLTTFCCFGEKLILSWATAPNSDYYSVYMYNVLGGKGQLYRSFTNINFCLIESGDSVSKYFAAVAGQQERKVFDVSLAWEAPFDFTIVGYKVYWGEISGQYNNQLNVGTNLSVTITNLQNKTTYYFAAVSYDVFGNESDFSNEINYTTPVIRPPKEERVATFIRRIDASSLSGEKATKTRPLKKYDISLNPL